jgi:hypothetical protein
MAFSLLPKIRKVKAVSPSPFYDGKYHPPFIEQLTLLYYNESVTKVEKIIPEAFKTGK